MKKLVVTTSWDDGHVLDVRLSELLKKYHIKGTFYIATENHELTASTRLTPAGIRKLSKGFEIGAHTVTHRLLTGIPDEQARQEIQDSKIKLENIVGQKITSFCYPSGSYDGRHIDMVANTGFTYARTVRRFRYDLTNSLAAPTTVHAYRHFSDLAQILVVAKYRPLKAIHYLFSWDALAIGLFERARKHGGIYHLWGHSWEIDKTKDWQRLEKVLAHIGNKPGIIYATNGALA